VDLNAQFEDIYKDKLDKPERPSSEGDHQSSNNNNSSGALSVASYQENTSLNSLRQGLRKFEGSLPILLIEQTRTSSSGCGERALRSK